jgi:hypothetical protein
VDHRNNAGGGILFHVVKSRRKFIDCQPIRRVSVSSARIPEILRADSRHFVSDFGEN